MNYISNLLAIQIGIFRYGGVLVIIIGTASTILGFSVFMRKGSRRSPCAFYLLCWNLANFFYIYSLVLFLVLSVGFDLNFGSYSDLTCKIIMYSSHLFDSLSSFYLILASVDRAMITSPDARTRQRSTVKFALISVARVTLFWLIFHLHAIVMSGLVSFGPGISQCVSLSQSYSNFLGL